MRHAYIRIVIAHIFLFLVNLCCSHPTDYHQYAAQAGDHSTPQSKSSIISNSADSIRWPRALKPDVLTSPAEELATRALESSPSSGRNPILPNPLSKSNISTTIAVHSPNDPSDPTALEQDHWKLDVSSYGAIQAYIGGAQSFAIALTRDIVTLMRNTHSQATDRFPLRNYRFCDRVLVNQALCVNSYDMNGNMTYVDMTMLGTLFERWVGEWVEEVPGCHMLLSSVGDDGSGVIRLAMAKLDVFGGDTL